MTDNLETTGFLSHLTYVHISAVEDDTLGWMVTVLLNAVTAMLSC